jgi:hypothetical protein
MGGGLATMYHLWHGGLFFMRLRLRVRVCVGEGGVSARPGVYV